MGEKNQNRVSKNCGAMSQSGASTYLEFQKEKKKGSRKTWEEMMAKTFPKLMTDTKHRSRKLREHEAEKHQNTTKPTPRRVVRKLRKTRDREKILKEPEGAQTHCRGHR